MMVWKLPRVDPGIEWREYPSLAPGDYSAYCRFAKNYRDPAYRRWVCLLLFDVLTDDLQTVIATVPCFLALGHGEKPYASRRGSI
jgi:hypothetical protein